MTDRAAFLAAINAAPDDDAPRLIFADWLDEHGEPERAEFIRVQEKKKNTKPCKPWKFSGDGVQRFGAHHKTGECDWCDLAREESRLLKKHERKWLPAGWVTTQETWAGWRCGFVESITCTAADCITHLDAIRVEHPIREVTLTTAPTDEYERSAFVDLLREKWPGITFHLPQSVQRTVGGASARLEFDRTATAR